MAVLILIILLLRAVSVLSDVQCDCNSLTFIKDLLQQERFERKLENTRIWSELKKISTGSALIETDSAKDSDVIKRVEILEQQYDLIVIRAETSPDQSERFQTIVKKAFRDEKAERIHVMSHVLSEIDEFHKNATEFKTSADRKIINQATKWSKDHISQQNHVQKLANSVETVKDDLRDIAEKTDAITVDLEETKTQIHTYLRRIQKSASDAKSSANECLNTVAALKSDVKDIETSMKGSTDTVSDLTEKFEKHVNDATKQFHAAAKKIGTCRGMKGYETQLKENWKLHESKCFRFFGTWKSWLGASESCKEHNAHLVTIESKEENDFIISNIDLTRVAMWIGLNDMTTENVWKWQSTNNTLQSGHFSNWNPNEPSNDQGNEDCVEMYDNGLWNDLACDEDRWFACQQDPEL